MTWNSLHPLSVIVRSSSRSLNTGFLFFVVGVGVSPGDGGTDLFAVGAMVLVGILVGAVYEFAYYKRFKYRVTDDTFDVISGVLSRRDREVPLRRVQNVDIRQNVVQRLLDIAAVHVETAGGGETEVTLEYVSETEAKRLRRRLREGPRSEANAEPEPNAETGARSERAAKERERSESEDEELLFEIAPKELAILSVFTIDSGASILGGIALSFASGFDPTTILPIDLVGLDVLGSGLSTLAAAVFLFLLAAWILSAGLTFTRYYGFRLTRVDDGLYYERGLLQRYSGTIPLEKVQTVTIAEPVPMRWFGYASLAVETAGYAPGQSDSRGTESAIPLADRDRVLALARSIEPFEGVDLEGLPARARERYAVRYTLLVGLLVGGGYLIARYAEFVDFDAWYAIGLAIVAVPVAAHLKWRSRGYRLEDRYLLARTGFWRRTTKVVPYYRVQAAIHSQSIFQRRRHLASVTADTASSATFFGRAGTVYDVDATRGLEVQETINDRLQKRLLERKRRRSVDDRSVDHTEASEDDADEYPFGDDRS
ncbi:PH domain-containing protein [Natrialbaceae archaeon GCM10025810]|uniref:PH domain-containing protein n=1 Tax=Halovalidus salilacus TaxID=3075124 RepID=UPI0036169A40